MENKKKKSICIGITGGFASGKTTVAKIIEEYGFPVIYTDDLAKELMEKNEKIKKRIKVRFGDDVFNQDGSINNKKLAKIVFANTKEGQKKLQALNVIIHPAVIDEMSKLVDKYEAANEPLIFVESALIFELGLDEGFDYVIAVYADDAVMIERAKLRGFNKEQVKQRLSQQLPAQKKLEWGDFTINNNGSLVELREATISLLNILKAM